MKKTSKEYITTNIPLQIRIGVTGHRNLKDTKQLRVSIRNALTEGVDKVLSLNRRNIATPLLFRVLSPLADGADRIIAIETMDVLNAEMEVVLPMIKEEYKPTFYSDDSRQDFENLLTRATYTHSLILEPLQVHFPGLTVKEGKHAAYKKIGEHVVDNCDILIAIWDGERVKEECGTYATLIYASEKKKSTITVSSKAPHKITIEPGDDFIGTSLQRFELFNSYKITIDEQKYYSDNVNSKLFHHSEGLLNLENINYIKEKITPYYIRASQIAKKYQRLYQKTGLIVYVLSPLAVAFVALGILFHHSSWFFFLAELIILMTILLFILFADHFRLHEKWIQNRYLTEQLRSFSFFIACGFKPLPIKISTNYRVAHRPDDWMVKVYDRILWGLPDIPLYDHDRYKTLAEYIKVHWIQDQLNYHKKNAVKAERKNKRVEISGWLIFAFALIAAAVHLITVFTGFEFQNKWITDYIIFLAISLPALGASLGAIRNHREYSRISKRSENMVALLEDYRDECENVNSMDDLKTILENMEESMLHDTQDWLMLMKFVKLEAI